MQRRAEQNKIHFKSAFNFLNQHNGLRPNKMHLFIAPTHVGKSTLTHALINDLLIRNKDLKILLYLTEESLADFENAISSFVSKFDDINNRVNILVEDKTKSDKEIKAAIEDNLMHCDFDLFFMDNITTSKLYMDRKVETQSEVATWLKGLLEDTTLYIIAHTNGNNYNTEMLDETHIRGSKTITNITEFLYVMQPVRINDSLFQFIRIIKHRGQSPDNKFFKLIYSKAKKTITDDRPCSFEDFKEIFKLRNKL
jgi:GTPase SAR1 family protein